MWQLMHPEALWLLAFPVSLLIFFLIRPRSSTSRTLVPFSGPSEVMRKESRRAKRAQRLIFAGSLLAISALAVVAARPVKVTSWTKRSSEGIDIVVVFDVSESMEATDFSPNRMTVAHAVLRDFIRRRSEDRIGIVAFGGEAVTKSPLTRDYDFLISQVDNLLMRELKQGTAIGMGLSNGIARLRKSESKTKIIVLMTDGDSNVGAINPITAAHLAKQEGIKIYTIGIGKANRVVVPIYAYDGSGRRTQLVAQVPSYINPALLKEIARLTGGNAYMARDSGMLNRILQEIDKLEKTKVKLTPMQKRDDHFFPIALSATLALFFLYVLQETRFRRGRMGIKRTGDPSGAADLLGQFGRTLSPTLNRIKDKLRGRQPAHASAV